MKTRIYLAVLLAAALTVAVFRMNTQPAVFYTPVSSAKIDINLAEEEAFAAVFGEEIAQNIIRFRAENGAFPSVDALRNVPGISLQMLEDARGALREP